MINDLIKRVHRAIVVVLPWLLVGMAVVGVIILTTEQPGWQPEVVGLEENSGENNITANITGQWRSPVNSPSESSVPEAPAEDSIPGSVSASEHTGMADEQTAVMTGYQPRETDTGGPWVIYLASLRREEEAVKFIAMAQSRGVSAASHPVTVRGHEYWRVYVHGFASAAEANTEARHIKEKLDLDNVWIAKR